MATNTPSSPTPPPSASSSTSATAGGDASDDTLATLRGRTALHEFLELLVLRQRAVGAGVAGVVVLGLLLTLLAPGLVPSTALSGVLVGLVALAVGVGMAFVVHRQDVVLRAPGQARWDGGSVLAWVGSLRASEDLAPAVAVLRRRVDGAGRQRLLVVDGGAGSRATANALGTAAADAGLRTLVVDLTDTRPVHGMADVAEGTVRLADAVEVAPERTLARIGAGRRVGESVRATIATLERPNRDLDLVLVVSPEDQDGRRALLPAVDRVVLAVNAGSRQRSAVRDRLVQLGATGTAELLLVGGHLTDAAPGAAPAAGGRTGRAGGTTGEQPSGGPPSSAPPQVAVLRGRGQGTRATPPPPPPASAPPAAPSAPGATADATAPPRAPWDDASSGDEARDEDPDGASPEGTSAVERARDESVHAPEPAAPEHAAPEGDAPGDAAAAPTGASPTEQPWQLRPFRAPDGDADPSPDPDPDPAADPTPTPEAGAAGAAGDDDGVALSAESVSDDPDATADLDGGDHDVRAEGSNVTVGEQGAADRERPPIDLAEPRDLVTTATLEFLASGDGDERR